METKKILSSKLKCMSKPIKELINMGMWFLYEVHNYKYKDAVYFLAAGREYYFLSSNGEIIASSLDYPHGLEYDTRILFDDIPFPESIDNFQPAWA
ncbi:MAG: hypothetical protein ACTTKH_05225 [Treponema sp.]